jgi:cytochrome c oxidase subunit 3
MNNRIPKEERLEIKKKTHKNMMWIGITSIVMMFIGFSSAYIVAKGDATWVSIAVPQEFYTSSIIIVLSSITFFIAVKLAKKENKRGSSIFVVITLILGLAFVKFQWTGWENLMSKGMNFVDALHVKGLIDGGKGEYGVDYSVFHKGDELKYIDGKFYDLRDEYNSNEIIPKLSAKNNASSYMYLLSGLHLLHLLGGIISLIVVSFKSLRGLYTKNDTVGIEVSSIYWHFLDFLWLYLLFLLYYVG